MSTEKRSNAESIEIDGTKPHNKIVCLNCGAVCHSKFCPECGQPTSTPPRITHTSLAKTVAMSYARLTPGFWPTLIGLLRAPWKVIADYVNGKRITYSPPVTMLIQTVLYVTLILTVIKEITGVDFSFIADDSTDDTIYANWIERALAESDVFVCLVTVTPIALAGFLTYRKRSRLRYNFAEFMVGAIYMANLFIIVDILCIPIEKLISDTVSDLVLYAVMSFYSLRTISKAFPIKSRWMRMRCLFQMTLLTIIGFAILCGLLVMLFWRQQINV